MVLSLLAAIVLGGLMKGRTENLQKNDEVSNETR